MLSRRRLFLEQLESRFTLNADVDSSGLVGPRDALLIANALYFKGAFESTSSYDVNGDGWVTSADFDQIAEALDWDAGDGSAGGGLLEFLEEGEGEETSGSGSGSASLSIAALDANKDEGAEGTTSFTFRITLTGEVPDGFDVAWSTIDILASSVRGSDPHLDIFNPKADQPQSQHFTGTDGETRDITVTIWGDAVVEIDETFQVSLGEVTNVAPGYSVTKAVESALGNIRNDDSAVVQINDPDTASESSISQYARYHYFYVSTSAPVEYYGVNSIVVPYAVNDITTTSADYTDSNGGSVSLPTQPLYYFSSQLLRIDIVTDNLAERLYEDYYVHLESVQASGMAVTISETDSVGDGRIENMDTAHINITTAWDTGDVDHAKVHESVPSMVITVTLSCPVDAQVVAHLQTSDPPDPPAATPGLDYTAIQGALGNVVIDAGETSAIAILTLLPDTKVEGDEWFHLAVNEIVSAQDRMVDLGGDSTRDIQIDEDDTATVSIVSDVVITEPSSGFDYAIFTVQLSSPVEIEVRVFLQTKTFVGEGWTTEGTDGDYLHKQEVLTFVPGQTSNIFAVRVYHDNVTESDEFFEVDMSMNQGTEAVHIDEFLRTCRIRP